MVIFLFLRNFWATIIPSITVPVALICTFAVMYLMDYSLDNLSLMALTIAVGFVVDDAIVMLENIFRHIEDGMRPMEAAIKGAGEIGFTIVSISSSLIAVFIPLLLMGGIVGRLFREFAVTVTIAVVVSAFVSLTLTPMMCSRFLHHDAGRHGLAYRAIESFFTGLIAGYRRTLDVALRFRFITLLVFLATVGLSAYLYIIIPKGLFPPQDNGVMIGTTEAAQDISFKHMGDVQQRLADVIAADPDTAAYVSSMGGGFAGATNNQGRVFIALKPWDQRVGGTVQDYINRLRPKMAKVSGRQAVHAGDPGCARRRTAGEDRLPVHATGRRTWTSCSIGRRRSWSGCKTLPMLRDVTTDQQIGGTTATLTIDRDQAARFGIQPQVIDDTLYDAFGQRQIAQYFTQVNSYHVILEVLPEQAGDPATLNKLYVQVIDRPGGAAVHLRALEHRCRCSRCRSATRACSRRSRSASTWRQGAALGDAVNAIKAAVRQMGAPITVVRVVPGHGAGVPESLKSQPYLLAAALISVYIILGILYESYILPITILSTLPSAGVGALLMLLLFHSTCR